MYQKHSSAFIVAIEHRMMLHALITSWGCSDPYTKNGAVLATKDGFLGSAVGTLVGDHHSVASKHHWDDPDVYDGFVPAELNLLKLLTTEKAPFQTVMYITTVPHPDHVKLILDRDIKHIIYLPVKPAYVPKNYLKGFAKLSEFYNYIKIEKYGHGFHWLKDKLNIVSEQIPQLFS